MNVLSRIKGKEKGEFKLVPMVLINNIKIKDVISFDLNPHKVKFIDEIIDDIVHIIFYYKKEKFVVGKAEFTVDTDNKTINIHHFSSINIVNLFKTEYVDSDEYDANHNGLYDECKKYIFRNTKHSQSENLYIKDIGYNALLGLLWKLKQEGFKFVNIVYTQSSRNFFAKTLYDYKNEKHILNFYEQQNNDGSGKGKYKILI